MRLDKIPKIAVEVLKYGNGSIGLLCHFPHEFDATLSVLGVVPGEVICIQEKEYSAASLVANARILLFTIRFCQQQLHSLPAVGCHHHPTLALCWYRCVLDKNKSKHTNVISNGLVIVPHENGNKPYGLGQFQFPNAAIPVIARPRMSA